MSNVINFPGITSLDLDADRVLVSIQEQKLVGFVLAGYTESGEEFFSSTYADGGDALWLIERFKKALLETVDAE